jgi:hypothetical protein
MLSGCAGRNTPESDPAPAATPSGQAVMGESLVLVREGAVLPDTGALAAARQASRERAQAASRRVASITLAGDSVRLELGGRISFADIRPVGRDSSGAVVQGFAPRFSIVNQQIARFDGPGLYGLSVGRTTLRVEAVSPGQRLAAGQRTVRLDVPVIVTPATGPLSVTRTVTDSVPRDLVLALLGAGRRSAALRVGTPADGMPAAVVAGWVPMGSVSYGPTSTSVFRAPYSSRAALDSVVARFQAAGWTRPPERGMAPRGFLTSSTMGYGSPEAFCNGTRQHVTYSAWSRVPDESQVFIHLSGSGGQCTVPAGMSRYLSMLDSLPIPRLAPHPDMHVEGGATSGSGSDGWGGDATAQGRLSVVEATRHYAEQLEAQGWTADELAGDGTSLAVQAFRRTFNGKSWWATLTVAQPTGSTNLILSFRLRAI